MLIKHLGIIDYQTALEQMKAYTEARTEDSNDQIWFLQHPSVYTSGFTMPPTSWPQLHASSYSHIPWVHSNRGGKITHHGPGQLVCYLLLQLKRYHLSIRGLVDLIEQILMDYLNTLTITATTDRDAPGIYIQGKKVASIGLRVSRGCSYHGFSLNIDMDLAPFTAIPVCGSSQLDVTNLSEYTAKVTVDSAINQLNDRLCQQLNQRMTHGITL